MDGRNPQISATLEPETYKQLTEMAKRENRSISLMASILIGQAVKERNRKRKTKDERNEI